MPNLPDASVGVETYSPALFCGYFKDEFCPTGHSSLFFIRSLKIDKSKLEVEVTVGVQRPEQVDIEAVKSSLPVGSVTVRVVKGGLDIVDPENNDSAVIASAAIAVRIEVM